MKRYLKMNVRQQLADNLADLFSIEEIAVLHVSSQQHWLNAPHDTPLKEYAWACHSVVEDALNIKMRQAHESVVNPAPAPIEEVSETVIPLP